MVRHVNRLTDRRVQTVKDPGRHADGNGLYLVVEPSEDGRPGSKRWAFLSWKGGRQRELGLGGLASVSLAMARSRAEACRRHIAEGRDPREALREVSKAVPTFGEVAEQVITSLERGWRNPKHRQQWRNTLETYAAYGATIWMRTASIKMRSGGRVE